MKPSLASKFSVNVPKPEPKAKPETPEKAARGSADRPAITVRVSRTDWRMMREFADLQSKSLNTLLIEGFQAVQRAAGAPPIKGD